MGGDVEGESVVGVDETDESSNESWSGVEDESLDPLRLRIIVAGSAKSVADEVNAPADAIAPSALARAGRAKREGWEATANGDGSVQASGHAWSSGEADRDWLACLRGDEGPARVWVGKRGGDERDVQTSARTDGRVEAVCDSQHRSLSS